MMLVEALGDVSYYIDLQASHSGDGARRTGRLASESPLHAREFSALVSYGLLTRDYRVTEGSFRDGKDGRRTISEWLHSEREKQDRAEGAMVTFGKTSWWNSDLRGRDWFIDG